MAQGRPAARPQLPELLTRMRTDAGMTQHQLAGALGWTQSKLAKIETGRTLRPELEDIRAIARETRTGKPALADAIDVAGQAAVFSRSYTSVHARGITAAQRDIAKIEAAATGLRTFQPSLVPGLLQTAEYARLDLEIADISGQRDIARAVAGRLDRQATLYDVSRKFDFVIHESALRWHPGGPEVMAAQADRIISVATLPSVSIGVIPFRRAASVLFLSGFIIYDIPGQSRVLIELLTSETWVDDAPGIDFYLATFARLAEAALYGDEAAELIRSAAIG